MTENLGYEEEEIFKALPESICPACGGQMIFEPCLIDRIDDQDHAYSMWTCTKPYCRKRYTLEIKRENF